MTEEDKIKRRLFYINKTQDILEKQVQSKFFIQTTATGLIAFLALFITLALGVMNYEKIIFKILIILPIILAGFATYFLLKNMKYHKSFIGINNKEIIDNIDSSYDVVLKLSLNSNIQSIEENKIKINKMGLNLDKAIKYLLWSTGLLISILIFNNFTKMSDTKKNNKVNTKKKDNYKNDEKFLNTENVEESDYFEVSKDSLMATNKEIDTLKSEKNQRKKKK